MLNGFSCYVREDPPHMVAHLETFQALERLPFAENNEILSLTNECMWTKRV